MIRLENPYYFYSFHFLTPKCFSKTLAPAFLNREQQNKISFTPPPFFIVQALVHRQLVKVIIPHSIQVRTLPSYFFHHEQQPCVGVDDRDGYILEILGLYSNGTQIVGGLPQNH
ncbi:uncharacterized protein LOC131602424 isoform X1 [Vicia villosa]|uniref:uncharacterized protein LOC131602424 isoform X1 n=1 Tax=Vicia villosa TaxID=3911 RepID=UPI00273C9513|nr:uncharacterized protein LOC131602424 isoform X1 [Vicia villosa]